MSAFQQLLEAVRAGDAAGVRALLAAHPGALRDRPPGGDSPILEAAYRGDLALAAELAAASAPDLCEAVVLDDAARAEALLAADASVVGSWSADGWSPLHLAAFFGRAALARRLLDLGADPLVPSRNAMANTALHAAIAGRRDRATIDLLLARGYGDTRAAGGYTPLHIAASRGDLPLVELLVLHGADPAIAADDGQTPAQVAAGRGFPEVARRLGG